MTAHRGKGQAANAWPFSFQTQISQASPCFTGTGLRRTVLCLSLLACAHEMCFLTWNGVQ